MLLFAQEWVLSFEYKVVERFSRDFAPYTQEPTLSIAKTAKPFSLVDSTSSSFSKMLFTFVEQTTALSVCTHSRFVRTLQAVFTLHSASSS